MTGDPGSPGAEVERVMVPFCSDPGDGFMGICLSIYGTVPLCGWSLSQVNYTSLKEVKEKVLQVILAIFRDKNHVLTL